MLTIFNDDDNNHSSSNDGDFFTASSSDESFNSVNSSDSPSVLPLSNYLESTFSEVPKNFNVVHFNAQSLPSCYPELLMSLDQRNVHAIIVTETWLHPNLPTTSYSLPGFILIRNDRITSTTGGGVAIYIKANIPYTILTKSSQPPPESAGEHLFIEIVLSCTKILLGAYYCPSSSISYFSSFETLLSDFCPNYNHSIIMGDFNTCLLKQDYRSNLLESVVKSCNIKILPLNATHHTPNKTPSLLDLMMVASTQHVALHGQYSAHGFSHHDLIYLSYKIRPPKQKPRVILQRNFSGINRDSLLEDADKVNWNPVFNAVSVNDQVNLFNSLIVELYDKHAPLRAIKIKQLPAPWLTDDIRLIMRKKVSAKSRYKMHPTDVNKEKYVQARNRCNMVCRDALRRYVHSSVQNENPAKVWKFLKSLGIGKTRRDSPTNNLDINSLNQHFSFVPTLSDEIKNSTIDNLSAISTPDFSPFVFSQITEGDVKKSILSITSNAVGGDSVSRNMLLPILDIILPVLCFIFNYSLSTGEFPIIWKEAQIIPLPKKCNPSSFSEYRPISILPFLSKVLERLVHTQLNLFLNKQDLLNPFQSGFRPGHSTVTALIKITDDIRRGMDDGKLTVLTLLDFSNAFNTVNFDILLALLRSINISPSVIKWFYSYLYGRRQRVRLEDTFSSWCNTTAGVPQGGVLSPLLFAIFINTISQQLSIPYHLYADDLQIYTQSSLSELQQAVTLTNTNLDKILHWSTRFGLKVNPIKTQVIIIGSSYMTSRIDWTNLPGIVFDGVAIPFSSEVRNLGVIMDINLSWDAHLSTISGRMFASGASLSRLKNFLPTATKVALAQSLLLPILDYADTCYLDLREDQLNKLERLQNYCIRFIFGLRKYDHVSHFRAKLKWLPIRLRRNAHLLSLVYNILFNPTSPRYLKECLTYMHDTHARCLRSSENLKLVTPSHNKTYFGGAFAVQAVKLWNTLPKDIKESSSLNIFKNKVKSLLLSPVPLY